MHIDTLSFILNIIVLFVYGCSFIVSVFFAFAPGAYNVLNEKLNFDFLSSAKANPIGPAHDDFDQWLNQYHVLVGLVTALFCLLDLRVSFDIINSL